MPLTAVLLNVMFVACIFQRTGALPITIGKCKFQKPEDLCFFEIPQEQILVEKGGNTSINLLLYSSEAIGQGLNATRQNISVMDTDNNVIINGNNVTGVLGKNWKVDVDFIQHPIKRRVGIRINLTVSLNHATDSDNVKLHLDIRYDNLIYKTGNTQIRVLAASSTSPSPTPNIGTESPDDDGNEEDKSSQSSTIIIISIMAVVILCLCLHACWMHKKLNNIQSLMSTQCMPLRQFDTNAQPSQDSRRDTLSLSAGVAQNS